MRHTAEEKFEKKEISIEKWMKITKGALFERKIEEKGRKDLVFAP